jgi:selenocysteine lyase/cysteine desulfurase
MAQFDVAYVRAQFPALKRRVNGQSVAYSTRPAAPRLPSVSWMP